MLSNLIDWYLGRRRPHDPMIWHRGYTRWPLIRTIDGYLTGGNVWCRWNGKKWEYKEIEETIDDYWKRQW